MSLLLPAARVVTPVIVKTPPTLPKISLPAVAPLFVIARAPAVTLSSVMSPLVDFVLMVAVKVPVPVSIVVPLPLLFMVITAAPESRCASTAPVSFAVKVRAPLLVVIFALMRMDLPACMVKPPPPVMAETTLVLPLVPPVMVSPAWNFPDATV